jgi:uncharacterized small protein (DUF1192 family)
MADSTRDETKALWAELARLVAGMSVPELKALLAALEAEAARTRGRNNPGKTARKRRRVP